jgi:hypothetical protein
MPHSAYISVAAPNNFIREKGFELFRSKKVYSSICRLPHNFMVGHESHAGNPLVLDFILVARKLEKLGFVYHRKKDLVIGPTE